MSAWITVLPNELEYSSARCDWSTHARQRQPDDVGTNATYASTTQSLHFGIQSANTVTYVLHEEVAFSFGRPSL